MNCETLSRAHLEPFISRTLSLSLMRMHTQEHCAPLHSAIFDIAHTRGAFHTSDPSVLRALSAHWTTVDDPVEPDFTVNIYVDGPDTAVEPVHFRGMGHLIFVRYGK